MSEKASEFFKKNYFGFVEQAKTIDNAETAAQYISELATALFAKRTQYYPRELRAAKCIVEAMLTLCSVTEAYPYAHTIFMTLKNDQPAQQGLIEKVLQQTTHLKKQ